MTEAMFAREKEALDCLLCRCAQIADPDLL
jgi:hypothetical protein